MHAETSLATIDLIEAMRCLGIRGDLRRITLELIGTVERAGMPKSAVEAAVSIRDAVDAAVFSRACILSAA